MDMASFQIMLTSMCQASAIFLRFLDHKQLTLYIILDKILDIHVISGIEIQQSPS